MMSNQRRFIGWALVSASLIIHAFTVWCYATQPDSLAAFTVLPFWFWGAIGLITSAFAFCFLRAPLSLILTAVWAVTLSVAMDEARVLSHFGSPAITPERKITTDGTTSIRVATINCADFAFGTPIRDLEKWNPDIVLIQQAFPHQTKAITDALYGAGGDYRAYMTNGIATRFQIQREIRNPTMHNQQVTLRLPNGREIEVVNVHLASAATDLRLWSKKARATHRLNRDLRKKELAIVLQVLEQTTNFPNTPAILGGDFNAGATDIVHRQITPAFDDAFAEVGRGWGNTFHRRFPILRIDHIYATRQLQPQSCGTAVSKNTDHRIVIADFLLPK